MATDKTEVTATEKIEVPRGTMAAAWEVVAPYWRSRQNWASWLIVGAILGSSVLVTWVQFLSIANSKDMMDAITGYDLPKLTSSTAVFVGLGCLFAVTSVVDYGLNAWLEIRWRTWLTQRFLAYWLHNKTYYRIERERILDNPDQRIAEDVGQLIQLSTSLSLGLINTLIKLATFATLLWTKAGSFSVAFHGTSYTIPGYMLWCALIYCTVQMWFVHLAGRALMRVNFIKQRVEGNFRFGLASIRSHPEQIAMYDGGDAERRRMEGSFEQVRQNMWQVMFVQLRFNLVRHFLENLSGPLPILLAAPGYFSRAMTFGDVVQVATSFSMVVSQLNWFVLAYQNYQVFRVVVARLYGVQLASEEPREVYRAISYEREPRSDVRVSEIALRTPQDKPLGNPLSFAVESGARWMVRGKSGAGKSTLMRALAGIWPYGDGDVHVPEDARLHFLPQRTYLPVGTLKAALCYPSEPDSIADDVCKQALIDAELPTYGDRLGEVDRWAERLSQGEQQRLAIAGALIQKPDFLFLDEATSALDPDTEQSVYRRLLELLPRAGIVHVSHHATLARFHDQILEISAPGPRAVLLDPQV